jgi:hypothetical protein
MGASGVFEQEMRAVKSGRARCNVLNIGEQMV